MTSKCIKSIIPDCLSETRILNKFDSCLACGNGKYSISKSGESNDRCAAVKNPDPHCLWGSFYINGKPTCNRCKDGYAVSNENNLCIKNTIEGCLVIQPNLTDCYQCNSYEGYSINAELKCVKTTSAF